MYPAIWFLTFDVAPRVIFLSFLRKNQNFMKTTEF